MYTNILTSNEYIPNYDDKPKVALYYDTAHTQMAHNITL